MLSSLLMNVALAATPTPSKLSIPACEFADTYQFRIVECSLAFDNAGNRPIHLSNARATKKGDAVAPSGVVIPAHGVAYLKATIDVGDAAGRTAHQFEIDTDEPGQPHRYAEARGFVASVLDESRPTIDFGVIEIGPKMPERETLLDSREVEGFRVTGIIATPPYLDASIAGDGKTVRVRFKSDAPWGLHQTDRIELSINAPQQRRASILIKSDVHGDVVPADNPFALGLMRTGNKNEFLIRLTSRSGSDFQTGAVELERVKGSAAVVPCAPAAKGCKMVRLRIGADQPTGQIGGIIHVELPGFQQRLPIYVWGMLLTPQTQVKDLDEETKKTEAAKAAAGGATSPLETSTGKVDLKQVLAEHVREAEKAPPAGNGPLLKWSVAHEELVHSYIVYRAGSEAGPFLRVSKDVLLAQHEKGGASYQWRDMSAEPGKAYWYYVGLVLNDGQKQKLTGPQKVVAK